MNQAPPSRASAGRRREGRKLSLVIPMHNESEVLDILFGRLDAVIASLGLDCEIIAVDDGSRDNTLELLLERAQTNKRLRVLPLARNFGKEAALTAGLDNVQGDLVVPLDADLQDPPELIADFVELWEQGYDVVYGVRSDRTSDSFAKRMTAGLFYKLFNRLSDYPIPADTGDFRLMDRRVVDALKQLPERNRFNKGLFAWVGFKQIGVTYVRPLRAAGSTSWGSPALWRLAIDGITAFSTTPLRVWSTVGVGAAALAVLGAVAIILRVLIWGRDVPGYASLMVVTLFCFAAQMIAFGVMGEYLGRLYQEAKGRPIYILREP
ncbi:MAG: glycosyltransferase [Phenylobacterium zucineum]|nr:MAG: glycosyltransferase [Phenylobacterium zucineum]